MVRNYLIEKDIYKLTPPPKKKGSLGCLGVIGLIYIPYVFRSTLVLSYCGSGHMGYFDLDSVVFSAESLQDQKACSHSHIYIMVLTNETLMLTLYLIHCVTSAMKCES